MKGLIICLVTLITLASSASVAQQSEVKNSNQLLSDEQQQDKIEFEQRYIVIYKRLLTSMLHQQHQYVAELSNQLSVFDQQLDGFCQQEQPIDVVRKQWPNVLLSWAKVTALPLNVLQKDNRLLKIESFPLRKGFVAKKINEVIDMPELKDINGASKTLKDKAQILKNESVVVQGLPALEYLFFNNAFSNKKENKPGICDISKPIVFNLIDTLKVINGELEEQLGLIDGYDFDETLMQLDNVVNNLDQALVDTLKKRLHIHDQQMDEYSWRQSKLAMSYILQRITTINHYFYNESNAYSISNFLLDIRYRGVSSLLEDKTQLVNQDISVLQQRDLLDVTTSISPLLESLHVDLTELERFLTSAIYASISISRDFNSTDGD